MRKILLFLTLLILFQYNGDVQSKSIKNKELYDIIQIAKSERLLIDSWKVVYRDKLNKNNEQKAIHFFDEQQRTIFEDTQQHQLYKYDEIDKENNIKVTYQLIIPKENDRQTDITITLSGQMRNEDQLFDTLQQKTYQISRFFTHSPVIYTCLFATDSDIINEGNLLKNISNRFDFLHSFTQRDTQIHSNEIEEVYGFNPEWDNYIQTKNSVVNTHIVVKRDENERNLVTIGTPIILNEY